jgi:hypothetical protein
MRTSTSVPPGAESAFHGSYLESTPGGVYHRWNKLKLANAVQAGVKQQSGIVLGQLCIICGLRPPHAKSKIGLASTLSPFFTLSVFPSRHSVSFPRFSPDKQAGAAMPSGLHM